MFLQLPLGYSSVALENAPTLLAKEKGEKKERGINVKYMLLLSNYFLFNAITTQKARSTVECKFTLLFIKKAAMLGATYLI